MPNSVTINAWNFDPGFAYGTLTGLPQGWSEDDGPGTPPTYAVTLGPAVDLTPHVISVTLTDHDDSGDLTGLEVDKFTISGVDYWITAVWFGDSVTVDGQDYVVVTLYGSDGFGNDTAITFPTDTDGKPIQAFTGDLTGTKWIYDANEYPLPFEDIPCFTRGTFIKTVDGDIPVEELAAGDFVITKDNGPQQIRWVGSRRLNSLDLLRKPNLRPIRITKGALGNFLPLYDLVVSPQHRILVRSKIVQRIFGCVEILVAAKDLMDIDGIGIDLVDEVEYYHILLDRHEIVISNGAETESLYTGPQAMQAVGAAARHEIMSIFPDLADVNYVATKARSFGTGRLVRNLAQRHAAKGFPLVQ